MNKNTDRLNLAMPANTKKQIIRLQERTGASNISEVIRKSLAIYDLLSREIKDNKATVLIEKKMTDGSNQIRQIELMI